VPVIESDFFRARPRARPREPQVREEVILYAFEDENEYDDEDEKKKDDEGGNCRAVVRRVKTTHRSACGGTPKLKPCFEN